VLLLDAGEYSDIEVLLDLETPIEATTVQPIWEQELHTLVHPGSSRLKVTPQEDIPWLGEQCEVVTPNPSKEIDHGEEKHRQSKPSRRPKSLQLSTE